VDCHYPLTISAIRRPAIFFTAFRRI
jgi:hypothetical protein